MTVRVSSLRQERERSAAVKRETPTGRGKAQLPQGTEPAIAAICQPVRVANNGAQFGSAVPVWELPTTLVAWG
jgi:hypothetical protein